jgi:hypothetical protein
MRVDNTTSLAPGKELASAKDDYLQRVKDRLTRTQDIDRKEEKERIQDKHKKKRLREKGDKAKEEDGDEMLVTLDSPSDEESESDDDDNVSIDDVQAQEELALQMLGR